MSQETKKRKNTIKTVTIKGNIYAPGLQPATSEHFEIKGEDYPAGVLLNGLFDVVYRPAMGSEHDRASFTIWLDDLKELHTLISSFLEQLPK